jgi:hypothetical protein
VADHLFGLSDAYHLSDPHCTALRVESQPTPIVFSPLGAESTVERSTAASDTVDGLETGWTEPTPGDPSDLDG